MLKVFHKITSLMDAKDKRKFYLLLGCVILASLMELLTISTFVPFMAFIAKGYVVDSNPYTQFLYQTFAFESTNKFLMLLGGIVLVCLLIANFFGGLVYFLTTRFSFMQGHKISTKLLTVQMEKPYYHFLNQHTSELGKNILQDVHTVVFYTFMPFMLVFSKIAVTALIFGLLLYVDLKLALMVTVFLGLSFVALYGFIRKPLRVAGSISVDANANRYRVVSEAFGGIKDIKVLGREHSFIQLFEKDSIRYAKAETFVQVSYSVSRYILEIIAFGGILTIILYLIVHQKSLDHILPMMGLYAFAGYRLMPSMQHIFSGLSMIRYQQAALDTVCNAFKVANNESVVPLAQREDGKLTFNRDIEISNVVYQYPSATQPVLSSLSFKVYKNQTIGFVGSTGAGKTTIIDIILGLLKPKSGEILVDGVTISNDAKRLRAWQNNVGYVPQQIFLADRSFAENIAMGLTADEIDKEALVSAAKLANLHEFIESQELGYQTQIGEKGVRLSGGQRQRIGIARALYHNPDVLIFDEATSALDNLTEFAIMEAISQLSGQKTIIIIAHRLSTVKRCDNIFLMDKGKISSQGTYDSLIDTSVQFKEMTDLE